MRTVRLTPLLLLATACASAPAVLKTSSSPNPPGWVVKTPRGGADMFFVGTSNNSETLDDGKKVALQKARGEAAKFLGVEITSIQHILDSNEAAGNINTDDTRSRAAALIKGATEEDVYYEKISRQAGATTIDRFDVWLLAKISKAELQAEKERQASEAKISLQNALAWLREAQEMEKGGQVVQALSRYRKAEASASATAASTETGDAALPNAGRLYQVAHEAAASAQHKVRRAVIVAPGGAAGALAQALSAKGFTTRNAGQDEQAGLNTARADGTPWVIVATEQRTPGGRVFNQVAAQVALEVRVLDAKSGATVATLQKDAKEVGRTPEVAAQAASHEAGLSAGKELAKQLVEKESTE